MYILHDSNFNAKIRIILVLKIFKSIFFLCCTYYFVN